MATSPKRPEDFKFASPEVNACPYPFYAAARSECPVYEIPGQKNTYLVSRYEDVQYAANTPELFSSHRPAFGAGDPEMEAIAEEGYPMVPAIVTNDPPEHTRFKRLVNRPFTLRSVKRQEPAMADRVDKLIDSFIDDRSVELMDQFAKPFPTHVIGDFLGVPEEDQKRYFQRWADDIADSVSLQITRERALECKRSLVEMQKYFAQLIEERKLNPGDDLISDMVTARSEDDNPLDVPEILELIRNFVAGGVESTASLIGSAMYHLLLNPQQLDSVYNDHSLIPQMLEEALRLEAPVQWNPRLIEREDVSLRSVQLPQNSRVMLGWAAANHDPEAFGDDADEFNIFRKDPHKHLSLGSGIHTCLGATLARSEGRIAFERLFTRLRDIKLAVPADEVTYVGAFTRRLDRLPLEFDIAA
ncbi:cytochrome P450 [Haloechinothrix aidingensis]|uniref:cytochrome P450 n=1 Tax=Haloechinothrix aidingensis TaxID=2752311 RepID=UPI001C60AC08|nr:cytochrome P450 [Haloechinothrix aidingensis]